MINIRQFIRFITVDPVNLSFKNKLLSVVSSFCAILIMALITQKLTLGTAYPIIVASMGASAVILFIIPHSPLAQPWPFLGGQLISAIIGVACALWLPSIVFASACAAGGSILAMLLLRCLHPPGAATAIAPVLMGDPIGLLGYGFVLAPVALNVTVMLLIAIVVNRWLLHYDYPMPSESHKAGRSSRNPLSEQDLMQVLKNMDVFIDVSARDLRKLLNNIVARNFKRFKGQITCADIMVKDVRAVEYGTEVEEAWTIMHNQQLKAMPVIDKANRVIGIITVYDFFKFANLGAYETFHDRFRAFVRRTPDISTSKPESVGHIMTAPVMTMPESTHIVDLVPLMSINGYRQVPIINSENRLVGMVYQADLIGALYCDEASAILE
ncbi:MAG: HPP family protein [Methylobacter sp.]